MIAASQAEAAPIFTGLNYNTAQTGIEELFFMIRFKIYLTAHLLIALQPFIMASIPRIVTGNANIRYGHFNL
jgi:hypothetical protein